MVYTAAFDGLKLSMSTLNYSIYFSELSESALTGLFLEDISYKGYPIEKILSTEAKPEQVIAKLEEKDKKKREESVNKFRSVLTKRDVPYSTLQSHNIAIQEIRHQSQFTDLLIIDKKESFTRIKHSLPTRFIKDVISSVHSPMVIVPSGFRPIDKTIFLYDGSPASMHAIKMYAVLFKGFDFPVEVLSVNDKADKKGSIPANKEIRKYLKEHFSKIEYTVLNGNAEEEISGYLKNHTENELVVLGAYKRSELSRWFKTSMADLLMKNTNAPLFIANSI
jgi:nucleotide-binding universal stress UspA family protein